MKTSYWYCRCLTDSDQYSIREKNKQTVVRRVKELSHHRWGHIVKVTIEGKNLFEIIKEALGEGGLRQESIEYYKANKE